ncbi:MAG: hypothetical protein ACI38Y_04085, partial [Candidatus Methanomethylophilaceae archaeon]
MASDVRTQPLRITEYTANTAAEPMPHMDPQTGTGYDTKGGNTTKTSHIRVDSLLEIAYYVHHKA